MVNDAILFVIIFFGMGLVAYFVFLAMSWRRYRQMVEEDEFGRRSRLREAPRRFVVQRNHDVTGISGEGRVAEGVVFSDGWGVTHWLDRAPMNEPKTEVWHKPWYRRRGPDPFTKISGHGGNTVLVWVDEQ